MLLQVTGLRRSFYGVHALEGVDLAVEPGTITGLIGPNGAGSRRSSR
jgi:ABC-type branched-subunit amino acid transport system ATPase component